MDERASCPVPSIHTLALGSNRHWLPPQFAARVRLVPNEAKVNEHQDPEQLLRTCVAPNPSPTRPCNAHPRTAPTKGHIVEASSLC